MVTQPLPRTTHYDKTMVVPDIISDTLFDRAYEK